MVKKSSGNIKDKISDASKETIDKIETLKKESKSSGKGKKSFMVMILSFIEDLIKSSGEILLAFAELGMVSKGTIKNVKHKIMKSFISMILVLVGAVIILKGLIQYLEFLVPQLANGTSFVFVGLLILSVAYLYNK